MREFRIDSSAAGKGVADIPASQVAVPPVARRRRMVRKTNAQALCVLDMEADERQDATRQVYLVTFAHP